MSDNLERQIRCHCRRGMLELDILLNDFYHNHFAKLSFAERTCFAKLLDAEDPILLAWLMGYSEPEDSEIQILVQCIRDSRRSLNK